MIESTTEKTDRNTLPSTYHLIDLSHFNQFHFSTLVKLIQEIQLKNEIALFFHENANTSKDDP